jgi:nucleotide-binding universal stress UspA family protein
MRILVGTDGSEAAKRALEFAAQLATDRGSILKIVSIVPVYDFPAEELMTFARQEHESLDEFLNGVSEQTLKVAEHRAMELGAIAVQSEARTGDVAKSILDIARRDGTNLIVLGKRGRGPLSGLHLGSVSRKVASLAPCAVTVVP